MLKRQVLRQMNFAMLIFLLLSTPSGFAASVAGLSSWENLNQLEKGQLVKVVLKDTKAYEGKFQARTEESIQLLIGEKEQTLLKSETLRISKKKQGHRLRNTLIGTGTGTGAGLAVGAVTTHNGEIVPRGAAIGITTTNGLLGGAAVGAVIPTDSGEEIYRNP
ncbi:MAG TPA: hypothetical protein VMW38_27475 [Terriglobia bacterium]|nr:hypothetical protein [Terriglobia bacterium]